MKSALLKIFVLTVFLNCITANAQTKRRHDSAARQKKTVNENCASFEGQNSVYSSQNSFVEEPKSVTEKNFTNYLLSYYPNGFPNTEVVLSIVFQPNSAPCCRQAVVKDSLEMDSKQINFLTDLVLNHPACSNVQFIKEEKIKYLRIYMSHHTNSEFSVAFGN